MIVIAVLAMRVENESERQLIVANEELSSLKDVVRVMPMAQYLNVAFNCLSNLGELQKMTELRSLDISHNTVESLQEVATLSNLLVFKCSSNHITDLSWIAGLHDLEELWVRDNRISNAQLAHLQQLTALQTLVIHPNLCTERDDYVLTVLKILPWLQRVDTVVVTSELREEARHAEERGTLDSGATDCSLFSLSGRSEDPRSNEDCLEARATTAPAPNEPMKTRKQLTAEEIMRAFPVQEFISLDSNGQSAVVLDDHLMNPANEPPQLNPRVFVEEIEDNQNAIAADQARASNRNLLSSGGDVQGNQPIPEGGLGIKRAGILDSVLTLPTFDKDSFLQKKKPQSGNRKSKQQTKPKPAATGNPEEELPFRQNEEYTVAYPNSTVTAIHVRFDGSAIARWSSGSVAISVDFESYSDRSGYRVYAAHKDGQLALSFDPSGVGFLNAYPSGKTLLSTTSDGDGLLFDLATGGILRQWNSQGRLRDGACQPVDTLGDELDGSLLCRLSEHLAISVRLANSQPEDMKQEAPVRRNPIALRLYFSGSPGIRHVFVNSANRAEPSSVDACDFALGKSSSKGEMSRAVKAKPPPIEHIDLLSSIRAAVAGL
ncbi:hypothetical protein V7S43_003022 [Phytophthora oleae]|uniref:Uncharacterized protein n=1 Tax=Phytophthora oleae TaxID=2107226 RepID=A0ABD3FZK7_9STRA